MTYSGSCAVHLARNLITSVMKKSMSLAVLTALMVCTTPANIIAQDSETIPDGAEWYELDGEPPVKGTKLAVLVCDYSTGLPVRGVRVDEMHQTGKKEKSVSHATTGDDGYFVLKVVNPDDSILLSKDGYVPTKVPLDFYDQLTLWPMVFPNDDLLIMYIEDSPVFPGGTDSLRAYISNNMVYPEQARKEGIQGRVLVQFIVEKDGSVSSPSILKEVHPYLDAEALRIVSGMPKWSPARQRGKPVRVKFTVPVDFKL